MFQETFVTFRLSPIRTYVCYYWNHYMLAIVYICVTLKNNNIIVNYIICFSAVAFSIRFVSYDFSEGFIYLWQIVRAHMCSKL